MCKDYYAILGVSPDCEDIVVRAAYRVLAQRYHPDKAGPCESARANAHMQDLNEAYAALCIGAGRNRYDQKRRVCAGGTALPADCAWRGRCGAVCGKPPLVPPNYQREAIEMPPPHTPVNCAASVTYFDCSNAFRADVTKVNVYA
jgi:curved DNA-binding protein CbpA